MPVQFSDYFGIRNGPRDGWFDPIIGRDTRLFIDPFLVQKSGRRYPEFRTSHERAMRFFEIQFKAAAKLLDRKGIGAEEIKGALRFPEVNELHLGYSKVGNSGAGSSKGFANQIFTAILELIDSGITSLQRFEELSLFGQGFGADRIGDMMANLMKPELVAYTTRVCKSMGVRLSPGRLEHFRYVGSGVWDDRKIRLPSVEDEAGNRRPVLLVPKAFLRDLPTIDASGFWDYSYARQNAEVRRLFGQDVKKGIAREKVFKLARTSAKLRAAYLANVAQRRPEPYDVDNDPDLYHKWLQIGRDASKKHPARIQNARDNAEFLTAVDELIDQFKHFVEQRGGWKLLIDSKGHGRPEAVAQRLFDGIAWSYCKSNDIDYAPEANAGRGPVDFKFSSGFSKRALLEVKLARNTRIIHGIEEQLPTYLKADKIKVGHYVVIRYRSDKRDQIDEVRKSLDAAAKKHSADLRLSVVDAKKPHSASKSRE